ncbi:MAG: YwiC-like family protein [Thermoanaerobaculia bacterium]
MTSVPFVARPVPTLRPIAWPSEHGGWGFLFEPILLAMIVAPSWTGALIALAFVFGFLLRQPLKFALQDALRGKRYPRTSWCWMFAAGYATAAGLALSAALVLEGPSILIPLGLAAPLAITQIVYDATNKGRSLFAELGGATAMTSSAVAIAIAGGMRIVPAFALAGIVAARLVPTIVYVRTLVLRSHRKDASSLPPLMLHAAATAAVAAFAPLAATIAMIVLFARAAWGLSHPPLPAKAIGWREIAFGAITIGLVAITNP